MQVRLIDPFDAAAFDAWFDVVRITDEERWPGRIEWEHRTLKAMAQLRGGAMEFMCLSATDESGATVGTGGLEAPMRDNLHRAMIEIRVLPGHRRRHIGTAIMKEVEQWAARSGRTVLWGESEVPAVSPGYTAGAPFARSLGFRVVQRANRRHLTLPMDTARMARLKEEVARSTTGYRVYTFTTPWPAPLVADACELQRRMSTDAPSGDAAMEEEIWDAARIEELDDLLEERGMVGLLAVAEHVATARLVAFSQLAVSTDTKDGAWQWATLVLREHRGHRLGLAVKLANIDFLCETFPTVRTVATGNAQENGPMIAVNEMMGFEVVADQEIWEKDLTVPG